MSWSMFDLVETLPIKRGCVHAPAPRGCEVNVYQCRQCGTKVRHQCGNNGLIGWHNCPAERSDER